MVIADLTFLERGLQDVCLCCFNLFSVVLFLFAFLLIVIVPKPGRIQQCCDLALMFLQARCCLWCCGYCCCRRRRCCCWLLMTA
mmetsp:Transcript_42851/g.77426  ORF Transcript_42851/g.77426 Transcript_42851/m.77426 type:complete len:84 (+) Transcript_42851:128-379(+)